MIIRVNEIIQLFFPRYKYTPFKDEEIANILFNDAFLYVFSEKEEEMDTSFREYLSEALEACLQSKIRETKEKLNVLVAGVPK